MERTKVSVTWNGDEGTAQLAVETFEQGQRTMCVTFEPDLVEPVHSQLVELARALDRLVKPRLFP